MGVEPELTMYERIQWPEGVRVRVLVRLGGAGLLLASAVVSEAVWVGRGVEGQQAGEEVRGERLLEFGAAVDLEE